MRKIYFRNILLILGFVQFISIIGTNAQISKGGVPIFFFTTKGCEESDKVQINCN